MPTRSRLEGRRDAPLRAAATRAGRPLAGPSLPALLVAAALAAGCGRPASLGEANSLILVAPDSLWASIGEEAYAHLEPTIFTTREEKKFVVTHVDPGSPELGELLLWKQVLVFAAPGDERLERILRRAGRSDAAPPALVQAPEVWARNQVATAVVLPPGREAEAARELLLALAALIDEGYRAYVRGRMAVSGVDTAAADSLARRYGWSLHVPRVYRRIVREDPAGYVVIFRNDNPDPADLIRSILVQALPALDSATPAAVAAWRASVDAVHYNVPQAIDLARGTERRVEVDGRPAVEVTGTWTDEGGAVPAAGPFLARAVQCPGRTVFLDAWLYAPRREKYEFMIQLEEILATFRCG